MSSAPILSNRTWKRMTITSKLHGLVNTGPHLHILFPLLLQEVAVHVVQFRPKLYMINTFEWYMIQPCFILSSHRPTTRPYPQPAVSKPQVHCDNT
jgi:hypothetical protein